MKTSLDNLGKWPVPGDEARKNNRMIYLPKEKWLNLIHGKENHILMSFFVSNDFCHFRLRYLTGKLIANIGSIATEVVTKPKSRHPLCGSFPFLSPTPAQLRPEFCHDAPPQHREWGSKCLPFP